MKLSKIEFIEHINTECDVYENPIPLKAIGVMIHSTAANNPYLKRYVNFPERLGENYNKNWFGSYAAYAGGDYTVPHIVIGLDEKDELLAVQILPFSIRAQAAGKGKDGLSANTSHIQIEICEDARNDKDYFIRAFEGCAELCAYLENRFGFSTPDIISHKEGYTMGIASPHGDPEHWLSPFGKDMNWFRERVDFYFDDPYNYIEEKVPLYRVQIGAFRVKENAEKMLEKAKAAGFADAFIKAD